MRRFFVEQMAMYSSYHRDPRNKASHFVGVPMIAFSLLVPMALVNLAGEGTVYLSLAVLFAAAVILFWIVLDAPIGIASGVLFLPFIWISHWIAEQGAAVAWASFAALFVVGWVIQLVGHAFEGRKPALVDNLLQVLIAPIFLVTEVAFALGLRKDLHDEVEARWRRYAATPKEGGEAAGA